MGTKTGSKTVKAYIAYLNEIGTCLPYEAFIIGGKERKRSYPNNYGNALQRHDPIAFNVGFREWKREN